MQTHTPEQVLAILRTIPSHGWTAGWTGRRDRALLALTQLAGLSYGQVAALAAGDVTIANGVATIRTPGGRTTLQSVDDGLLCGPCSLARWVHALDLTVVYPDGRVIATVIARAVPLTSHSPHLCDSNNAITEVTAGTALLPPIDQWGHSDRSMAPHGPASRIPSATRLPAGPRRHPLPTQGAHQRFEMRSAEVTRASGLEQRVEQLLESVISN